MRSKAYDHLVVKDKKGRNRLDLKVLDINLRRSLQHAIPFRYAYDGKKWSAYSKYDKCTANLPLNMLSQYIASLQKIGQKAAAYATDPYMQNQLETWVVKRGNVTDPKICKHLAMRPGEMLKTDIASCKKYPLADCTKNPIEGEKVVQATPGDMFKMTKKPMPMPKTTEAVEEK